MDLSKLPKIQDVIKNIGSKYLNAYSKVSPFIPIAPQILTPQQIQQNFQNVTNPIQTVQKTLQNIGQNHPTITQGLLKLEQPVNAVKSFMEQPYKPVELPNLQSKYPGLNIGYNYLAKPVLQGLVNFPTNYVGGITKTGLDVGRMYRGEKVPWQKTVGDIGQTGSAIMDASVLPFGAGAAKNVAENALKTGFIDSIKAGAREGLKFGSVYGLLNGFANNRDMKDLLTYTKNVLGQTALTGAGGLVVGGGIGGISYGAGKIIGSLVNAYKKAFPQASDQEAANATKQFVRDELGRFTGLKDIKKTEQIPIKEGGKIVGYTSIERTYPGGKEPQFYGDMRESIGLPREGVTAQDLPMGLSVKPVGGNEAIINAEQAKNNQFYIHRYNSSGSGLEFSPVKGKKIDILPGLETFIHKNQQGEWVISDIRTGMAMSRGQKTQKAAIEDFKNVITAVEKSGKPVSQYIEEAVSKFGETPNYSQRIQNPISNDALTNQTNENLNQVLDIKKRLNNLGILPKNETEKLPWETPEYLKNNPAFDATGMSPNPNPEPPRITIPTDTSAQYSATVEGGGFTGEVNPQIKQTFADWVNNRRAVKAEALLKTKEFSDLNSQGLEGILKFQEGNLTGRLADVKNYFDAKYNQVKDTGIDVRYKQFYLPQLWANSQAEIEQKIGRSLGTHPSFSLSSLIKNYREGIDAGLTPRFQNIGDLVGWYERTANKAIADKGFFDFLAKDGYIQPQGKAPTGWKTLNPDAFPKISVDIPGEAKYTGNYRAPGPLADMINNYLSTPDLGTTGQQALAKIANYVSSAKNRLLSFGVPGTGINFHGFNVLARSFLEGGPKSAFETLGYMVNPKAAGRYVEENLAKSPEAIKSGLTFSTSEMTSPLEQSGMGVAEKFGKKWNDWFEKPLFDNIIGAKKLQAWEKVAADFSKSMPEDIAKRKAADFVNNIYGGVNWEAMGRSRDIQNAFRSFMLTPDWLESNVRIGGGILKSFFSPKSPGGQAYRKAMTYFLASYAGFNLINRISSGHDMWNNDPGHAFEVQLGYTADGQKRYVRPYGTAVDFLRIPIDAAIGILKGDPSNAFRAIGNRLSVVVGPAVHLLGNVNWAGQPLYGKTKYGVDMNPIQSATNIAGELSVAAGIPSFLDQFLRFATGQQGVEQTLTTGFELPVRYQGGAYSNTQKQLADIAKNQGASGQQLYKLSDIMKGQKLSKNQMDYIQKTGDLNYINNILQTRADKEAAKSGGISNPIDQIDIPQSGNYQPPMTVEGQGYVQSSDAPQGLLPTVGTYGKALITDPGQTIKAILNGNPVRKVQGGAVILERQQGLGGLDFGDKSTQIDHKIALTLGGTNDKSNLQTLTNAENKVKGQVETYLYNQMKAGKITRAEAQQRDLNWRQEIDNLPGQIKQKLVDELATNVQASEVGQGTKTTQTSGYTPTLTGSYYIPQNDGNIKKIDLTPIEAPKLTGDTEFDKKLLSKYKGQLTSRTNDIITLYEKGKITQAQAIKEINNIKNISSKYTTKKIPWSKFKVKQIKMKALKKIKLKTIKLPKIKPISLSALGSSKYQRPLTSIV